MGLSVIVGSSWKKVSIRSSSCAQKVITPIFFINKGTFEFFFKKKNKGIKVFYSFYCLI
jgi:hypothetical protein